MCSLTAFDCPVFEDLYDCVCQVAGGSLTAANCIISNTADIAINWCGGWHHAKRCIVFIVLLLLASCCFQICKMSIFHLWHSWKKIHAPKCQWSSCFIFWLEYKHITQKFTCFAISLNVPVYAVYKFCCFGIRVYTSGTISLFLVILMLWQNKYNLVSIAMQWKLLVGPVGWF